MEADVPRAALRLSRSVERCNSLRNSVTPPSDLGSEQGRPLPRVGEAAACLCVCLLFSCLASSSSFLWPRAVDRGSRRAVCSGVVHFRRVRRPVLWCVSIEIRRSNARRCCCALLFLSVCLTVCLPVCFLPRPAPMTNALGGSLRHAPPLSRRKRVPPRRRCVPRPAGPAPQAHCKWH